MTVGDYLAHFKSKLRGDKAAVFHNADLYPPDFTRVRSVTWVETDRPVTEPRRLHASDASYPLHRYFVWAVTETPLGKWRREVLIDPLLFRRKIVHWRNFEASYDVAELEPASRERATYVLQEYFCPVDRFEEFVPKMAEILARHRVNALNVGVTPADRAALAWALHRTFAFVLYYNAHRSAPTGSQSGRRLIDAAISVGAATTTVPAARRRAVPSRIHAVPR
jgi:hypothetical protein